MRRAASREIGVGLAMIAALAGVVGLMVAARGGPGFLASRRIIEVTFRDAQGVRIGTPVRVAGLDAGRVEAVELVEDNGALKARLRLALPADLVAKLRQDVKITVKASLTGQACVDVVHSGRSAVALVPGQVVAGVESSMFDPILEQVGLGPVERSHLSHTISEIRETVDSAGPRLRQILGTLQESAAGFKETAEAIRPAIVATARRIDEAAPKVEATLRHVENLVTHLDQMAAENRPDVRSTLTSLRELSAAAQEIAQTDRPKMEALLDGLNLSQRRADRVLHHLDVMTDQGADIMVKNRASIDRTVANVRDTTDYADKLVQKIFSNPFYLSPFYKPSPEDIRAQGVYDAAQDFSRGAKELSDAVTSLQALQARQMTPQDRQAFVELYRRAFGLTDQLNATSRQLAESLKPSGRARR